MTRGSPVGRPSSRTSAIKAAYLAATGHDGSDGGQAPGPWELISVDVTELSTVELTPDGGALAIASWRPGEPVRRTERV